MTTDTQTQDTSDVSSWDVFYGRIGFMLRRCHQASISVFIEECARFDLTPTQFGVLCCLRLSPDIDQIGVARALGLDRSTAGSVIERLVNRGMIERIVDKQDRRKRALKLTGKGEKIHREAEPAAFAAHERMLQDLTGPEIETLLHLLRKLMVSTGQHNRVVVKNPSAGVNGAPAQRPGEQS